LSIRKPGSQEKEGALADAEKTKRLTRLREAPTSAGVGRSADRGLKGKKRNDGKMEDWKIDKVAGYMLQVKNQ